MVRRAFDLKLQIYENYSYIMMEVNQNRINTNTIPNTYKVLEKFLPTILKSYCRNTHNLPFHKEVSKTEIGHLFEHILLEYLSAFTGVYEKKRRIFEGTTSWNWEKDPIGVFHIHINSGAKDTELLLEALEKSKILVEKILAAHPEIQVN